MVAQRRPLTELCFARSLGSTNSIAQFHSDNDHDENDQPQPQSGSPQQPNTQQILQPYEITDDEENKALSDKVEYLLNRCKEQEDIIGQLKQKKVSKKTKIKMSLLKEIEVVPPPPPTPTSKNNVYEVHQY